VASRPKVPKQCGVRGLIPSAVPQDPYNQPLSLAPGTRLGVYQITAPIGEGGMVKGA